MLLELIKYAGSGWIPFLSTMAILSLLGTVIVNTISIRINIGKDNKKSDQTMEGDKK